MMIIIEENKDLSTLEFYQLIGSLMYHEERLKELVSGLEEKKKSSNHDEASSNGKGQGNG